MFNYGTENETRYSVDWFESNADYYRLIPEYPIYLIIGIIVTVILLIYLDIHHITRLKSMMSIQDMLQMYPIILLLIISKP